MESATSTEDKNFHMVIQRRLYAGVRSRGFHNPEQLTEEASRYFVPRTITPALCRIMLDYVSNAENEGAWFTAEELELTVPANMQKAVTGHRLTVQLWTVILQVVYAIPYDHDLQGKLTDLIIELTKLPEEGVGKRWVDGNQEWQYLKDLPYLSYMLISLWSGGPPCVTTYDEGVFSTEGQKRRWEEWLSLNAFVARLLSLNIDHSGLKRVLIAASIMTLRYTVLENEYHNPEQIQRDIKLSSIWILRCGKQLYAAQRKPEVDLGRPIMLKGGHYLNQHPLYTGRPHFSQERWNLWHRRFLEVADSDVQLDAQTRQLAREAAAAMEVVERDGICETTETSDALESMSMSEIVQR